MAKKLDLTGQRFGRLTVLRPAENIGDRTAWVCRCDCGQESVVRTDNLRYGRVRSCGCQRHGADVKQEKPKCAQKNNTSGVIGVNWWEARQRWRATICIKRKRYFFGYFDSFEEAVKARKRAENAREQAEDSAYNRFCVNLTGLRLRTDPHRGRKGTVAMEKAVHGKPKRLKRLPRRTAALGLCFAMLIPMAVTAVRGTPGTGTTTIGAPYTRVADDNTMDSYVQYLLLGDDNNLAMVDNQGQRVVAVEENGTTVYYWAAKGTDGTVGKYPCSRYEQTSH